MRLNSADAFLLGSMDWWDRVEKSRDWQNDIFDVVGALYAVIAIAAIVQLIRIQLRVPEYGWTTQKVFHLLNILVGGVRAGAFLCRRDVQNLKPVILRLALMDLPGLLFFTTYTLLVLFWAEIYYQARSISTDGIRRTFVIINTVIYLIQLGIWIYFWPRPDAAVLIFARIFFAGVSFSAALGFLLYGGRLFLMLRQFPVESKGRQKKLREVGFVTTICSTCFLIRCFMVILSAFVKNLHFDSLGHPLMAAIYYTVVEILPAALVLYILRKLPPRRGVGPYHSIH